MMRVCLVFIFGVNLFPGSPIAGSTESESWRSLLDSGRTNYERDEYAKSLGVLERAQIEASHQNVPELDQTEIWDALGAVYEATNNVGAAQEMFDRALKTRQRLLNGPDVNVAISLMNESSLYWAMNQPRKAEQFALASKGMWEQLHETERPEYAAALNNLSAAYRLETRFREALPLMATACKVYRFTLPPSSPQLLRALENMAQGFKDLGEYNKAGELHQEALDQANQNKSTPPALLSIILSGFGDLRIAQGRLKEAEALLTRAIAVGRSTLPGTVQLAVEYNNLSCAYRLMGRVQEAREQAETALALLSGAAGQANVQRGAIFYNLGLTAELERNFPGAERLFHSAINTWRPALGDFHPNITAAYSSLASLYEEKHQYKKARKILDEVLARDTAVLPRVHPSLGRDLNNLGSLEFRQRHYAKAESYLRQAVGTFRTTLGPGHPDTGLSEANLAGVLSAMKRVDAAQEFYRDSLRILELSYGPDNPKLIGILEAYAQLLRADSQSALAEQTETRAMHIRVVNAIAAEENERAKT
jgi:tetratricopeptide (TPR) repeat protein